MTEALKIAFTVECPQKHAFTTWTAAIDTWWPADHTMGGSSETTIVLEPHVGGRIFERSPAGTEHEWGVVTEWDPPRKLSYLWHIGRDISDATTVDIGFRPARGDATLVEIEHRGWDHLGATAELWRDRNQLGWETLLPSFTEATTKGGARWHVERKRTHGS
jgi:hypothetical protein